jgi:hypothetical protein
MASRPDDGERECLGSSPAVFHLAGCGKTIVARENYDSPRVWHNRKTEQDTRDWRGERDEAGNPVWARRAFLACLALHAPQTLADFLSILLELDHIRQEQRLKHPLPPPRTVESN